MWIEELERDNPMETFLVGKFWYLSVEQLITQWNAKKNYAKSFRNLRKVCRFHCNNIHLWISSIDLLQITPEKGILQMSN